MIKDMHISLQEYISLKFLYEKSQNIQSLFQDISESPTLETMKSLERAGLIKIIYDEDGSHVPRASSFKFRERGLQIFEGNKDYFLVWLNTFPMKVPGRVLRPASADTIAGRKLRKKWNSIFKRDLQSQQKAIKVLEAEMAMRRKDNSFKFMNAAETWLNKGNHEVYEHLLEDVQKMSKRIKEDFN